MIKKEDCTFELQILVEDQIVKKLDPFTIIGSTSSLTELHNNTKSINFWSATLNRCNSLTNSAIEKIQDKISSQSLYVFCQYFLALNF